jgi:hypothetical protein
LENQWQLKRKSSTACWQSLLTKALMERALESEMASRFAAAYLARHWRGT